MADEKPLTAKSSIGQWLKHPTGGPILRDLPAEGGQTEKALAPVKLFSLERMASMSGGMLSAETVADMVRRANAGVAAVEETDAADPVGASAPEAFEERITPGH